MYYISSRKLSSGSDFRGFNSERKGIMRKMKNKKYGTVVNVEKVMITTNMWEYFITDNKFTDDIVTAVVDGFETELGDISLNEINPYVIASTEKLDGLLPAKNWEWVE